MGDQYKAEFPHCDARVLHAPGECVYCDDYPEKQREREEKKINFTGHNDPGKSVCPAEDARPLGIINRWYGNVAHKTPLDLNDVDDIFAPAEEEEEHKKSR